MHNLDDIFILDDLVKANGFLREFQKSPTADDGNL